MRFILIFLAFNFIIIVHELGHFLTAKMFGMAVKEFSLFIGPKIFGFTRGGTTYSIRTLPIMAYVKSDGEEEKSESENAFNKKPIWQRAIVIFGGPFANIITAFAIILVVYLFSGFRTTVVDHVTPNSAADKAGIKVGDEIKAYDNMGTYSDLDILQFLYVSKGSPTQVEIKRGDNEYKVLDIAPDISESKYLLGIGFDNLQVKNFANSSPAMNSGILVGDKVVEFNGKAVKSTEELSSLIQENKDKEADVKIKRANEKETRTFKVKPKLSEPEYGLGIKTRGKHGNFIESVVAAAKFTYGNIRNVPLTVIWLVEGKVSLGQMMGPVGIYNTMNVVVKSAEDYKEKLQGLLSLTALLSVAIGATNLIPFPALDGSKLVLLAVEAIRRRPLKVEREAMISMVGFVVLILMFIYILAKDIQRLGT